MAGRNQQSHAKRARELAVKEKRELKRAKKAARAAGEPWGESDDTIAGEGENDSIVLGEGEDTIVPSDGDGVAAETSEDAASGGVS